MLNRSTDIIVLYILQLGFFFTGTEKIKQLPRTGQPPSDSPIRSAFWLSVTVRSLDDKTVQFQLYFSQLKPNYLARLFACLLHTRFTRCELKSKIQLTLFIIHFWSLHANRRKSESGLSFFLSLGHSLNVLMILKVFRGVMAPRHRGHVLRWAQLACVGVLR